MTEKKIRVSLKRSLEGSNSRQRGSAKGLGLRRLHRWVELVPTPEVMGMVHSISHLLSVEEVK